MRSGEVGATLSDGFAPGDRVRDINPDGPAPGDEPWSESAGDESASGAPSPAGFGAHPASGRGRRYVQSTTGGPTTDSAAAAQPTPPASLDWDSPEARAEQYEVKKTPKKGKKAIRAHQALIEERRRAEAEREAIEANVEARGVAGFRDANRHGSHVAMSNPEYAPSKMYEGSDPAAPERGKPWYKRLVLIIPVSVVLVAGLFAGIGLPAIAQATATADADEAARVFTQDLAEYHAAWTTENIEALTAATPHLGIGESGNALQQPLESQNTLIEECTVIANATRASGELANNPPPSLAVLPSASFSAAYREAQDADVAFGTERMAAQTMLGALSATLQPLSGFCTNFQAGIAIENQATLRDEQELAPLRTIPFGAVVDVEGRPVTCVDEAGCVNYADENARASYAAAWRSIHEERMVALVAHFRDSCWFEVLRPYCTLMSDAWDEAKSGISSISSAMANEAPGRDPAQGDFPRLAEAMFEQAAAFQAVADEAKVEAGNVDAEVLTDLEPGWETRMLVRLATSYETHLDVAVSDYRDLTGT